LTEHTRAIFACDFPDDISDSDLVDLIKLATAAQRWALVAKLSAELARREPRPHNVIDLESRAQATK
jgi:hypothetical protein